MFVGFSEKDGEALYDSEESAIERAKAMRTWDCSDAKVMVQRYKWMPSWFIHLFRDTRFEILVYIEVGR